MNTMTTTPVNGVDTHASPPMPSIKPVAEAVSQESARLSEVAKHLWSQGAERCKTTADTVRHEARAANERTQQYVRDEPVKSMLMAAAAGAALTGLVALMMKRGR